MEGSAVRNTHPAVIVAAASVTLLSLAGIGAIFGVVPQRNVAPSAEVLAAAPTPPALAAAAPAPVVAAAPAPMATPRREAATLSLPEGSSVRIETPGAKPRPVEAVAKPRVVETVAKPRPQPPREVVEASDDDRLPPPAGPVRVRNDEPPSVYAERGEPRPRLEPADVRAAPLPPVCRDCGTVESVREVSKAGDANGVGAVAGGVLGGVVGRQVGGGRGRDVMTVLGAVGGAYAGHQVEKSQRSSRAWEVTVRFDDGTTQVLTQTSAPAWRPGERVRVGNGQIGAL